MTEKPNPEPGTCEACGSEPATVFGRKVTGGEELEFQLCRSCAEERGLLTEVSGSGLSVNPVTFMLQNLTEAPSAGSCPGCGMTYSRFRETGRLGCAQCYAAFEEELEPLLRRVHGGGRHTGKVPDRTGDRYDRFARLRRLGEDLERAIGSEDYERAASLRDLIQELEGKVAGKDPVG